MSLDFYLQRVQLTTIYSRNITHNVNKMADVAGIYGVLWRPEENGIKTAADMIEPLQNGLARLLADPRHFRKFNPPNGWGSYEGLVDFVREVLSECEENPDAAVRASR